MYNFVSWYPMVSSAFCNTHCFLVLSILGQNFKGVHRLQKVGESWFKVQVHWFQLRHLSQFSKVQGCCSWLLHIPSLALPRRSTVKLAGVRPFTDKWIIRFLQKRTPRFKPALQFLPTAFWNIMIVKPGESRVPWLIYGLNVEQCNLFGTIFAREWIRLTCRFLLF